nr:heme-binding domain-containing protein [Myxococcota bacterium]
LRAFDETSVGFTIRFIIVHTSTTLDTDLWEGRCLSYVGREGTRELAVRACFDCHSNNTKWPWYAKLAPFSWAVQQDVDNARSVINFSEWNRHYPLAVYAGERTRNGMMPPYKYLVAHPEAVLTPEERAALVRGLEATLGRSDNR